MTAKEMLDKLRQLVEDALEVQGVHHTRWLIEQMADVLGVPVEEREGIPP